MPLKLRGCAENHPPRVHVLIGGQVNDLGRLEGPRREKTGRRKGKKNRCIAFWRVLTRCSRDTSAESTRQVTGENQQRRPGWREACLRKTV